MIRRRSLRIPINICVRIRPGLIRVVKARVEPVDLAGADPAGRWADVAVLSNDRWVYPVALCPGRLEDIPADLSGSPFDLAVDLGEVLGEVTEIEGVPGDKV